MKTSRRGLLRLLGVATAAGAAAPLIERLDWAIRQPNSVVMGDGLIELPPNEVSFTVNGLESGDRVAMFYMNSDGSLNLDEEPLINTVATGSYESRKVVYAKDREVMVRVRNKKILPFETTGKITNSGLTTTVWREPDSALAVPKPGWFARLLRA